MRLQRHVVQRKKQWLVAIPAEVKHHLKLVPTMPVYWHIGRRAVVSLTVSGRVRAGRPTDDEDCRTCAVLRAEVERLKRELREGEAATPGQWFRSALASTERALFWDLAELAAWARSQRTAQRQGGRRPSRRAGSSGQSRVSGPAAQRHTPDPPPSSESSGGAEASGAASPQASHSEITVQHL
jgi:hypothetical protein